MYPTKARQFGMLPGVNDLISYLPFWHDGNTAQPARETNTSTPVTLQTQTHADPEDYASAKRKLKEALLEFYRYARDEIFRLSFH